MWWLAIFSAFFLWFGLSSLLSGGTRGFQDKLIFAIVPFTIGLILCLPLILYGTDAIGWTDFWGWSEGPREFLAQNEKAIRNVFFSVPGSILLGFGIYLFVSARKENAVPIVKAFAVGIAVWGLSLFVPLVTASMDYLLGTSTAPFGEDVLSSVTTFNQWGEWVKDIIGGVAFVLLVMGFAFSRRDAVLRGLFVSNATGIVFFLVLLALAGFTAWGLIKRYLEVVSWLD